MGAAAALTGCAWRAGVAYSGPPGTYYDYFYYPDGDVYFYPEGHLYYWHDHDHWFHGAHLPPGYALHEEHREHLHLRTREPWTEHHREFGPGHRKEHDDYGAHHDSDRYDGGGG